MRSPAVSGRSSGERAVALAMTWSSSNGTVLTRSEASGTSPWTCWYITWAGFSPWKARCPVSSS